MRFPTALFSFLGFLAGFLACKEHTTSYEAIITEKVASQLTPVIGVHLDSLSGSFHQFKGLTNAGEYYFFNEFNLHIYIYDLNDIINEIKHQVRVPFDASINFRGIDALYVHNLDSIFIYDPTNAYEGPDDLFLINALGEIVDSYKIVNLNQGKLGVMESELVAYTKKMIFHDGFRYFPALTTGYTTLENSYMLIRYNLNTQEKTLHGRLDLKEGDDFAAYTYAGHFDLDPLSNRIYMSYAYKQDILYFDLNTLEWGGVRFETDFFKKPVSKPNAFAFMEENTWFRDIVVDTRNGTLMRKLLVPMMEYPLDFESESTASRMGFFRHVLFLIDPVTGNYSWVKDFNLFNVRFIHPEWGPMISVQVDHEVLGINPQDCLFFAPVSFASK